MCYRCLRAIEHRVVLNDDQSSIAVTEECDGDEDCSLMSLDLRNHEGSLVEFDKVSKNLINQLL